MHFLSIVIYTASIQGFFLTAVLGLRNRLLAKPFGFVELETKGNEVNDGFFYVRNITPVVPNN